MALRYPPLTLNASLRWQLIKSKLRDLPPDASALEIGCGMGAMGARIASRCAEYTAVELDATSASVAEDSITPFCAHTRIINNDLNSIGTNEKFDLVCSFEVIEHIENDLDALTDWVRRLNPGGLLLLSTPANQRRFGPWDVLAGHFRRYDPVELKALMSEAGLVNVTVRLYGMPLGYILESVRNGILSKRKDGDSTINERTANSGRLFQPSRKLTGFAFSVAVWPFVQIQRLFPKLGTGIVAWGTARDIA